MTLTITLYAPADYDEVWARRSGFTLLVLDVSKPQAPARKLYDSLGYQVTKVQTEAYGPDNEEFFMTYMEKQL